MHLHTPILCPQGPKLSLSNTPSLGKTNHRVVVITPQARGTPVGPLVPGVDGCAHGCMIEVIERHEDVRIVVARCGKTTIGMSEHAPETCLGSHGRNTRSVVDHTVLDEKLDNLLIEPVIDAIRIAMNEIDDLIL